MTEPLIPQIALIGSTASGKSTLALEMATKHEALILALDSLSIYREIDIASAKPSAEELSAATHYGINVLAPDENFDVTCFIGLYQEARKRSLESEASLIIVGGSSFYLKILLEGISPLPKINQEHEQELISILKDLASAYATLQRFDPGYAKSIAPSDRYRIEKALQILISTGKPPSLYFREHPPRPVISENLSIFEITRERDELRQRIRLRTRSMLDAGLIDEVASLEARYGREPNPMKAIGIREVLNYFDGRYSYKETEEQIVTDTVRLAKRQQTFNRSQFRKVTREIVANLKSEIAESFIH